MCLIFSSPMFLFLQMSNYRNTIMEMLPLLDAVHVVDKKVIIVLDYICYIINVRKLASSFTIK